MSDSNNNVKTITIIGLGLIGGSLVKIFKSCGYTIYGITQNQSTINTALNEKVIDKGSVELQPELLNNSELVFIATPLSSIEHYIKALGKIIKEKVIVSDVGSTKSEITKTAKKYLPANVTFIGGHPMAGTEKNGYSASFSGLFKNCAWIMTPFENNRNSREIEILKQVIAETGAKPIITDPEIHDKAVALISHLPLLISAGLCHLVKGIENDNLRELTSLMASSGFRDMTRIAGGNSKLSTDLLRSNFSELAQCTLKYYKELEILLNLSKEKPEKLENILIEISNWRRDLYDSEGKNKSLKNTSINQKV